MLREGAKVTKELFRHLLSKELMTLRFEVGNDSFRKGKLGDAALLLDGLVTDRKFVDFLTTRAYRHPRFDRCEEARPKASRGEVMAKDRLDQICQLNREWAEDARWANIRRPYSAETVVRLRGSVRPNHVLADRGARKFWQLVREDRLHGDPPPAGGRHRLFRRGDQSNSGRRNLGNRF